MFKDDDTMMRVVIFMLFVTAVILVLIGTVVMAVEALKCGV